MSAIKSSNKIESISILRVIGMFSIVGCHLFGFLNIAFLQQFLNFGVYLFLLISGYLYGNKRINNYKTWFLNRLKKLLIPYYLFIIPIIVAYYIINPIDIIEIIKYALCLQGINFIFGFIPFSEITPLGNLWFLTIIIICYLIMIPIKKLENKYPPKKGLITAILIILFSIQILLPIFNLPAIATGYFVIFFVGYYFSKFSLKSSIKTFVIWGIILFIFAILLRLMGKHYLDNDYQKYYQIIVSITHPLTAISSFFIIDYLTIKINMIRKIANSKLWNTLDNYSYYIYITHYAFLHSITSVENFNLNLPITLILFFILTLVSSIILNYLTKFLQKIINKP